MRTSFVLNVPAAVLILIGILSLQNWLGVYDHFIKQDTRGFARYACEMHPSGDHLIRQDAEADPSKAIACLCSSLSGCISVDAVDSIYKSRITESSLYIVAGAILVGVFFMTRKYLKAHGVLARRPRTISIIGSILAVLSIISFLVPISIGTPSDWIPPIISQEFPHNAYFIYFVLFMPLAFLAIGIGIFVTGRRTNWFWSVTLAVLGVSIVMIIISFDYLGQMASYWYIHRILSLILMIGAIFLLLRREARQYYYSDTH